MISRRTFAAFLLLGLLIRLAGLALPGTPDTMVWKIWSYNGARLGATRLYGVGGNPPERRLLEYGGEATTVDYPPLSLYEFSAAGHIIRALRPTFPNDAILGASLKLLPVLAEVGLAILLLRVGSRGAALAYWLNPAAILNASYLGYTDSLFVLPAVAALVAADVGWLEVAGGLFGAALLTKVQAILIGPVFLLILLPGFGRLVRFAAGMVYVAIAAIAPFVFAGAAPNMLQALASLTHHDMLSGYAANVWWIVTYLIRASYAVGDLGAWAAFTMPVRILAITRTLEIGLPNPRPFAMMLVLITFIWAVRKAKVGRTLSGRAADSPATATPARMSGPPDVCQLSAVGAFLVHAYFVLAVQVHENHLFMAIPLLALAASGRPAFRPILIAVSAIAALNFNLFYGIDGRGWLALPRGITIVDASVVLSAANAVALIWHARVLSAGMPSRATPRSGSSLAGASPSDPPRTLPSDPPLVRVDPRYTDARCPA